MIEEQIRSEMTAAMKTRDAERLKTLRSLVAAIQIKSTSGNADSTLDDSDVIAVLNSEAKKRKESITAFTEAGRSEMVQAEEDELKVIAEFLPEPLTTEELTAIVEAAIADNGFSSPADMGATMKLIKPQVEGRADGKEVADLVKSKLIG